MTPSCNAGRRSTARKNGSTAGAVALGLREYADEDTVAVQPMRRGHPDVGGVLRRPAAVETVRSARRDLEELEAQGA
jgi:hypothetical protein